MIFKIMIRIKCSCSVGYSGPTCSGSSCDADSCANEGVCEIDHQNGGFICHCKTGFTGPTCLRFFNVHFNNMIFVLIFEVGALVGWAAWAAGLLAVAVADKKRPSHYLTNYN